MYIIYMNVDGAEMNTEKDKVNFNEGTFLGSEFSYIQDAINRKHISGDGFYTKKCNELLERYIGCRKALLTHSGTAALEISALLLDIKPEDEIICPSYTFVTTANAFALRGAKIVFAEIKDDTLNIDENKIENLITPKTKAIVPVHYAGVSCEMEKILKIARKHNLKVVEDSAQAIGSTYKGKPCGSMGDIGCFSFHETKNIVSGEGGAITLNLEELVERAEIIREKGTNRSRFFRGQVDKYTWVDLGSSYLPSDMNAAYLYPQLEKLKDINNKRIQIWNRYNDYFEKYEKSGIIRRPCIPKHCSFNGHMFYIRFNDIKMRTRFIENMQKKKISTVFHYIPLHSSPAGKKYGRYEYDMSITNKVSDTLVRLPLFYGMTEEMQNYVLDNIGDFFNEIQ